MTTNISTIYQFGIICFVYGIAIIPFSFLGNLNVIPTGLLISIFGMILMIITLKK